MAGGQVPRNLAPVFAAAGKLNNIPANVLAGIASVESNFGANRGPSSAGAIGLMQFEPGTAKGLGIDPNNDRAAIYGAAKLLNQYGYQQNPTRALAAYNAGPGNYQAGLGYARQVSSEARRLSGAFGGMSGATAQSRTGLPNMPGGSTSQTVNLESQVPTFDQQGFKQAQARYILGSYLQNSTNPFDIGPKGASTGPNPLLASGVATTTAPNPQDFEGTKTVTHAFTLAQNNLQRLAGNTPLSTHPGLGGDFNTPAPQKVVDMQAFAKSLIGAPYSQANHAASFTEGQNLIKKYGTDCSGLVSLLLGRAGVLSSPQTTETLAGAPGIDPGRGAHVTIWNRSGAGSNSHMIVQIGTDWFESGGRIGRGVVQMSDAQAQQELSGGGFRPLHPRGF